jgi:hypothetical protein
MTKPNTDLHFERNGKKDFALRVHLNQQKLTFDLKSRYDFISYAGQAHLVVLWPPDLRPI